MPTTSFTTYSNGIAHVLTNDVGITKAFTPSGSQFQINPKKYKSIWDTGATGVVITKKVVSDLDLKPIRIVKVNHAGGESLANVYIVNIYLPNQVFNPVKQLLLMVSWLYIFIQSYWQPICFRYSQLSS